MQSILEVTVPFFALVLCGYVAAWRQLLPLAAIPGLNAFVLYFALPCMLFRFGASTPLVQLLDPLLLALYALAALLVVLPTVHWSLRRGSGRADAALGALVAAFPNSGFMGVPMLAALLGPSAVGPVVCSLIVDLFVTSALCIALAQPRGANHAGARQGAGMAAARALRSAFSNPLPWAIATGALLGLLQWRLPVPLDSMVRMLGDAATPVALFSIGVVLWRARLTAGSTPETTVRTAPQTMSSNGNAASPTAPSDVLPLALVKLLLHPLLVWLLGAAAIALGAPLQPLPWTALTLAAALPSASNVSLLAERYGADIGRVARIIMASTVLAFGSFSLLAWLLGVGR